jgi:phosphoribosyl-ATP pyrophosphohydrolase
MKKVCTKNRIVIVGRRGAGTRIDRALSLHSGDGKPNGIHAYAADFHSDNRWQPEATRNSPTANASVLEDLASALAQVTAADHPRTFKLLQSSRHKLSRKLIEEACEVTVEVVKRDSDGVVRESADLLYHLVVLWFHLGIEPFEIWEEMQARAKALGIAEKLPKAGGGSRTVADEFDR